MTELPNGASSNERIEPHQTPLVLESLYSQICQSSIFQGARPLEERVADRRRKVAEEEQIFQCPTYSSEGEGEFIMVPLDKIVGTVSPSFPKWGHEYGGRAGRHSEIIQKFAEGIYDETHRQLHQEVNEVFHLDDGRDGERISLVRFQGPAGPVYFISDGTHRVSVCKVLGLKEIPCKVVEGRARNFYSRELTDKLWWENLIENGLAQGDTKEEDVVIGQLTSKLYSLRVENSLFPWIGLGCWEFFKFNTRYNELYPGAFSQLRSLKGDTTFFPEEIFLSWIEFNQFIAGQNRPKANGVGGDY